MYQKYFSEAAKMSVCVRVGVCVCACMHACVWMCVQVLASMHK